MSLAPDLLEILVCPKCKGPLEHRTAPREEVHCRCRGDRGRFERRLAGLTESGMCWPQGVFATAGWKTDSGELVSKLGEIDTTSNSVVEKIFATPGIGPYFVDAAFNRDYFLVMGIVVLYSVFLLVMNLLVDIAYGFMDPRVRYE